MKWEYLIKKYSRKDNDGQSEKSGDWAEAGRGAGEGEKNSREKEKSFKEISRVISKDSVWSWDARKKTEWSWNIWKNNFKHWNINAADIYNEKFDAYWIRTTFCRGDTVHIAGLIDWLLEPHDMTV